MPAELKALENSSPSGGGEGPHWATSIHSPRGSRGRTGCFEEMAEDSAQGKTF